LSSATRTACHCPHLLLRAVLLRRRRPCSNRPISPTRRGPIAANPPHAAAADEWDRQADRQTDRRTPYRFRDPATRTYYRAVPMNPIQNKRGQCCLIIVVCQKYQLKRVPHTTRTLDLTFPEENIENRNTLHKKVSASQTTRDNLILFAGTAT